MPGIIETALIISLFVGVILAFLGVFVAVFAFEDGESGWGFASLVVAAVGILLLTLSIIAEGKVTDVKQFYCTQKDHGAIYQASNGWECITPDKLKELQEKLGK